MFEFHMPEVRQIIFLIGMILGALLSFLSAPLAKRMKKEEAFGIKLKLIGLVITLIFAVLLFTLS